MTVCANKDKKIKRICVDKAQLGTNRLLKSLGNICKNKGEGEVEKTCNFFFPVGVYFVGAVDVTCSQNVQSICSNLDCQ